MSDTLIVSPQKSLFLCYRRDDSEEVVDRIYETLVEHFSEAALFRDVDDIEPGSNFPAAIQERLRNCQVVLVFIGREWATIADDRRRRLDDPQDYVRIEVETALRLPHARVIPVLVKRAVMPRADQLPLPLRQLTELDALTIRSAGKDYKQDVTTLVESIRTALLTVAAERERVAATERETRWREEQELRRQEWERQGSGLLPSPLGEEQWEELLHALVTGQVVAVCGPDLRHDREATAGLTGHAHLAAHVAQILGMTPPPADSHRPLAQLSLRYRQDAGSDITFARALRDAARVPAPLNPAFQMLRRIEPLRLFLTSALDPSLDNSLEARGDVSVVVYTPGMPFDLDDIDLRREQTFVYHVAGMPDGVPGSVAVTDSEWMQFAEAWRDRRPNTLPELLGGRDLLFLGGGHPAGFVEMWLTVSSRLGTRQCWIGASVLAHDARLLQFVREDARPTRILFDDSGDLSFLSELGRRTDTFARAQPNPTLVPAVQDANRAAQATLEGRSASDGTQTASEQTSGAYSDRYFENRQQRLERPWPGLVPFGEADRSNFFGREEETRAIVRAVKFNEVCTVFGASGIGKTSLLTAGVVPILRAEGVVVAMIRVDWSDPESFGTQVLRRVMQEASQAGFTLRALDSNVSLWQFFHHRMLATAGVNGGRLQFALIFDQFEEFFTFQRFDSDAAARPQAAWRELADLVERRTPTVIHEQVDAGTFTEYEFGAPPPSVLIALREDFLPELETLHREMPSLARHRIRLVGLTKSAARDVIVNTGLVHGGESIFSLEAVHELIEKLSADARTMGPRGGALQERRVDPSMLALACYNLNERRLERGLSHVNADSVKEFDLGLESFYEKGLASSPRSVRRWIEDELVTKHGYRDSVALDRAEHDLARRRIPVDALTRLVDHRLLRISMAGDTPRIELVHDWLLPVVLKSRRARLQRRRAQWYIGLIAVALIALLAALLVIK